MKNQTFLIVIASGLIAFSPLFAISSSDIYEQRMQRWQNESVSRTASDVDADWSFAASLNKPNDLLFSDVKVNTDAGTGTFTQRACDVAHFSDGRGVVVWEDERNGVFSIFAQALNSSGVPTGANLALFASSSTIPMRQPRAASNSLGNVMLVFVRESDNGLYLQKYDFNMSAVGSSIRIDDATGNNYVNQPQIALISGNRFVVVWEDSRSGANIYAQLVNSDGSKSGSNFRINDNIASPSRLVPTVASSLNGDFAVVWEDGRSGNGDVYFRMFTDAGTALFPELRLDAGHESDYQFMPKLEYLTGSGFLAAWISSRDGGQSCFGQLISNSSVAVGSSFMINDATTDVCWDLNIESANDSGAVCAFAEYSSNAGIVVQKISKTASLVGGNINLEDIALTDERFTPVLARNSTGYTVSWCDMRNSNSDIYAQRVGLDLVKSASNYQINDDMHGAQQIDPDIAMIPSNLMGIVWQDNQDDDGDITLQLVNLSGAGSGPAIKVNDDAGTAAQRSPKISAANGNSTVVWEDSRIDGSISGQNIFCQRFNSVGSKLGANVLVNTDGTARPKSEPDVDVSASGKAVIVWIDRRDNTPQVYGQIFASNGTAVGGNFKVSSLPAGTQNFEPHVTLLDDGSFVVSWIGIIAGSQAAFFQRYSSSNLAADPVQLIVADSAQVDVLDLDIAAHDSESRFYVSTIQKSAAGTTTKLYAYTATGFPIFSGATVSSVSGAYTNIRVTTDIGDGIAVVWESNTGVTRRGLIQLMRFDGFSVGSNQFISNSAVTRVEKTPAVAISGGYYFCTWADSRNSGAGFDIYVNSYQYTSTDADDDVDVVLPQAFSLEQNYPNPFNPQTTISYDLSEAGYVKLTVFNILGQQIGKLVDEQQSVGRHEVAWDAGQFSSGVYFYRLNIGDNSETKKMTLLK